MKMKTLQLPAIAAIALAVANTGHAAPGVLGDSPGFLAQEVPPNIMILTDDSGSMDWENLERDGNVPGSYNANNRIQFRPGSTNDELSKCLGMNVMMYNPKRKYTPWVGVDRLGNTYANQNINAAMENPFFGSNGTSACEAGVNDGSSGSNDGMCNLEAERDYFDRDSNTSTRAAAYYYEWIDADNDDEYDFGECSFDNANGSRSYISSRRTSVTTLPVLTDAQFEACDPSTNATACHSKTNFANWFSYYRKREYVAKRALSQVISESKAIVGLATINRINGIVRDSGISLPETGSGTYNDHQEVGTELMAVDDISQPLVAGNQNNKFVLLRNLFRINSANSTPLRAGLNNVGRYFASDVNSGSSLFGFTANDDSPILPVSEGGECQQNFTVLMSDGFWNGNTPDNNNYDGTDVVGPNPYNNQSFGDSQSGLLADMAMKWYSYDLEPNYADKVPSNAADRYDSVNNIDGASAADDNPEQHLVTFTVAFGVEGSTRCSPHPDETLPLGPQGWPENCLDPTITSGGTGWPTVVSNRQSTIDDMRHAAWNGRGKFLSAGDPDELIERLSDAFAEIDKRTSAAAAAVAVQSTNLVAGSAVYQATFSSDTWFGNVIRSDVSVDANGDISFTPAWNASARVLEQTNGTIGAPARAIIVNRGSSAVPLAFPADYTNPDAATEISSTQIQDFLRNAPFPSLADPTVAAGPGALPSSVADNQTYGTNIVNWFRGDSTHEEGQGGTEQYRSRGSGNSRTLLGDFINSSPLLVQPPNPLRYSNSIEPLSPYSNYAASQAGREEILYIGGNDGMLHAIDASTGYERLAFIPNTLFSTTGNLSGLADPNYSHQFYVDGPPASGDVYVNFDGTGDRWGTVLIGTLRGGGRGLFALDVTNPALLTEANANDVFMWEVNNNTANYANMGFTFSRPTVVKLNESQGRWGVIVGNGYNNTGNGGASLFIIDAQNGSVIREIQTGVGSVSNSNCSDANSDCNGLSNVAVVDLDFNGTADRVYAGDVKGNLWAFDISDTSTLNWSATRLFRTDTVNPSGAEQPITGQPSVTFHPTERGTATEPNVLVFFGTGEFVSTGAKVDTNVQSFYAIWDRGPAVNGSAPTQTFTRNNLVEQTITLTNLVNDASTEIRTLSNNLVNYQDKSGWYFDLPSSGERVIVNPLILGDIIAFVTTIPAGNICDGAGSSWLMVANLLNGGNPSFPVLDADSDGVFDDDDGTADEPAAGVYSSTLYWQPTALGGDTEPTADGSFFGDLLLPRDDDANTIETREFQYEGSSRGRSAWGRINQ